MTSLPFELPIPEGYSEKPEWDETAFRIGAQRDRVLAFGGEASGWSEPLTALHEAAVGGGHFIDIASQRHALEELRRNLSMPQPVIMEVGCSGGHFLRELGAAMPEAQIIGADYTRETLEALGAKMPGIPLLQFNLAQCPLPDAAVDAAVLLNVLEHIEHDDLAVSQLYRILKPGGIMVAEVPAGPDLFDGYDAHLMHHRRYDMAGLEKLVRNAGFDIVTRSHLGFLIYPAFWATKKLNRLRGEAATRAKVKQQITGSNKASGLLGPLMHIEDTLRRHIYLPFGIRALITCRKPYRQVG